METWAPRPLAARSVWLEAIAPHTKKARGPRRAPPPIATTGKTPGKRPTSPAAQAPTTACASFVSARDVVGAAGGGGLADATKPAVPAEGDGAGKSSSGTTSVRNPAPPRCEASGSTANAMIDAAASAKASHDEPARSRSPTASPTVTASVSPNPSPRSVTTARARKAGRPSLAASSRATWARTTAAPGHRAGASQTMTSSTRASYDEDRPRGQRGLGAS